MFNVGGAEMIVIMVVALVVLGPNRLPEAARQVGKWMGEARRLSTGFQNEMRDAMNDVSQPFDSTKALITGQSTTDRSGAKSNGTQSGAAATETPKPDLTKRDAPTGDDDA